MQLDEFGNPSISFLLDNYPFLERYFNIKFLMDSVGEGPHRETFVIGVELKEKDSTITIKRSGDADSVRDFLLKKEREFAFFVEDEPICS